MKSDETLVFSSAIVWIFTGIFGFFVLLFGIPWFEYLAAMLLTCSIIAFCIWVLSLSMVLSDLHDRLMEMGDMTKR